VVMMMLLVVLLLVVVLLLWCWIFLHCVCSRSQVDALCFPARLIWFALPDCASGCSLLLSGRWPLGLWGQGSSAWIAAALPSHTTCCPACRRRNRPQCYQDVS
jgi:hypothetical protein